MVPFVLDLSDEKNTFERSAARKLITNTICESYSYITSRDDKHVTGKPRDLAFKPWGVPANTPASTAQIACSTWSKALTFLKNLILRLEKKVKEAAILKEKVCLLCIFSQQGKLVKRKAFEN